MPNIFYAAIIIKSVSRTCTGMRHTLPCAYNRHSRQSVHPRILISVLVFRLRIAELLAFRRAITED